jgi:hypothetical protein
MTSQAKTTTFCTVLRGVSLWKFQNPHAIIVTYLVKIYEKKEKNKPYRK